MKKFGVSGSWAAVKVNGSVSYIKSRYLKKQYKIVYVVGDGVNLRTGPGTGYSSVAVLPRNTKLKCLSKSSGWMKVKYKKQIRYISSSLTSSQKTASVVSSDNASTAASSPSTDSLRIEGDLRRQSRLGDLYKPGQTQYAGICRLFQPSA